MANSIELNNELEMVLERALGLVTGDRSVQHGNAEEQHSYAAAFWTVYLRGRGILAKDAALEGHDVAQLMLLLKVSRNLIGSFNLDTFVDQCGYAALSYALKKASENDD